MLDIPPLGYSDASPETQKSPKPGIFLVNRCKALKHVLQGLFLCAGCPRWQSPAAAGSPGGHLRCAPPAFRFFKIKM